MSNSQYLVINENCLNKANDLVSIGQKMQALETIRDLLQYRNAWHPSLESLMTLYVKLCVDLPSTVQPNEQVHFIRDGLHHYRSSLTSQKEFNTTPLENIIKLLNEGLNAKIEAAKALVEANPAPVVEGVEPIAGQVDERLLPSLRLQSDTYLALIEVLKHQKLESLYQKSANAAFEFAVKYERKKEMYKLGELLRSHVEHLLKPQNNYITPETIYIYIDVRFTQLNSAIKMVMWQEAFRAIEDINSLFGLLAKPKPNILANYYQRLAQIYWVSGSHLLHAYALYKHLFYNKTYNTTFTTEDAEQYGSILLIAALSSPVIQSGSTSSLLQYDTQSQRNSNLAALLGLPAFPKRDSFLLEVKKIVGSLPAPFTNLFEMLEERPSSPLNLATSVKPLLDHIAQSAQLQCYLPAFQNMLFAKITLQASRVYEVVRIDQFTRLIPFFDRNKIEMLLLDAIKKRLVGARIDHRVGIIRFGHFDFDSANIGDQLSQLACGVRSALSMIEREKKDVPSTREKRERYVRIINSLADEHRRILARKEIIERKKIYMEHQEKIKRDEEAAQLAALAAAKAERDAQRMKEDLERRQKDESKTDKLINLTISAVDKAKVEMSNKVAKLSKEIYYLERAYRLEEVPVIEEKSRTKLEEDRAYFEQQQQSMLATHQENHRRALEEKQRLSRMTGDLTALQDKVLKERSKKLPELQADQERRFQQFLKDEAVLAQQRKEKREAEKKAAAERRAREEEEQRLRQEREERERREREEQERIQREKEEQQKNVYRPKSMRSNDEPRRDGDNWRDQAPRRDSNDSWRDQPSRRDNDNWRDQPPRRDFNDQPPRRDNDNWRDQAPRRDNDNWRDQRDSPSGNRYVPPSRSNDSGGDWRNDAVKERSFRSSGENRPSGDDQRRGFGDDREPRRFDDRPPQRSDNDNWRGSGSGQGQGGQGGRRFDDRRDDNRRDDNRRGPSSFGGQQEKKKDVVDDEGWTIVGKKK